MEIGNRLKNARVEMGLTQEKVAEEIGVSRQTVYNWENGKCYPDIENVIKLSDLYSVSLDELLKEDKNMIRHLKESTDAVNSSQKLIRLILRLCYWGSWTLALAVWWVASSLAIQGYGGVPIPPHNRLLNSIAAGTLCACPVIIAVIMGFMGAVSSFCWRRWLYVPVTGVMFIVYRIVTSEWYNYYMDLFVIREVTGEESTLNIFRPIIQYFGGNEYQFVCVMNSGEWLWMLLLGAGCSVLGLLIGTFIRFAQYYFKSLKEKQPEQSPEENAV